MRDGGQVGSPAPAGAVAAISKSRKRSPSIDASTPLLSSRVLAAARVTAVLRRRRLLVLLDSGARGLKAVLMRAAACIRESCKRVQGLPLAHEGQKRLTWGTRRLGV